MVKMKKFEAIMLTHYIYIARLYVYVFYIKIDADCKLLTQLLQQVCPL